MHESLACESAVTVSSGSEGVGSTVSAKHADATPSEPADVTRYWPESSMRTSRIPNPEATRYVRAHTALWLRVCENKEHGLESVPEADTEMYSSCLEAPGMWNTTSLPCIPLTCWQELPVLSTTSAAATVGGDPSGKDVHGSIGGVGHGGAGLHCGHSHLEYAKSVPKPIPITTSDVRKRQCTHWRA